MRRVVAPLTAGLLVLAGCGGKQDAAATDTGADVTCEVADETRIGIATGNATGVYFALGNAYAEQIGATGGKVKATASETGASVQNIQQLVAGEALDQDWQEVRDSRNRLQRPAGPAHGRTNLLAREGPGVAVGQLLDDLVVGRLGDG